MNNSIFFAVAESFVDFKFLREASPIALGALVLSAVFAILFLFGLETKNASKTALKRAFAPVLIVVVCVGFVGCANRAQSFIDDDSRSNNPRVAQIELISMASFERALAEDADFEKNDAQYSVEEASAQSDSRDVFFTEMIAAQELVDRDSAPEEKVYHFSPTGYLASAETANERVSDGRGKDIRERFKPNNPILPTLKADRDERRNDASDAYEDSERVCDELDMISVAVEATRSISSNNEDEMFVRRGYGFVLQYSDRIVVATAAHVLEGAENPEDVRINLPNGKTTRPIDIKKSRDFDVAIMELLPEAVLHSGLKLPTIADPNRVRKGEKVHMIGCLAGLRWTSTFGEVSYVSASRDDFVGALNGKREKDELSYCGAILISAPTYAGSSGGPVVDDKTSELVGMVCAALLKHERRDVRSGATFIQVSNLTVVAKIEDVLLVVERLIEDGECYPGEIGCDFVSTSVENRPFFSEGDRLYGAIVKAIEPDSPAANAGLQPDDLLLSLNGEEIANSGELERAVALTKEGEICQFEVVRDGRTLVVPVRARRKASSAR